VAEQTADRVVRFLVDHARCTECQGCYRVEDVHVLHETGGRVWDLAAVCHTCFTLSIVRAIVRDDGDSPRDDGAGIGDVVGNLEWGRAGSRELTAAERKRFANLPPVDADDVLDMVAFLGGFDGDFRGLFSREAEEA